MKKRNACRAWLCAAILPLVSLADSSRELWSAASSPTGCVLKAQKSGPGTKIRLKPGWRALELTCEAACRDLVMGENFYDNGRILQQFSDAKGQRVGRWPGTLGISGTQDWRPFRATYEVPAGAVTYDLKLRHLGTKGTFSVRNLKVRVALDDEDLKPHDEPLPREYAEGDPWSLADAWCETNAVRSRICLNGLWRCRVACSNEPSAVVPQAGDFWGWAKVPGTWKPAKREICGNGVRLPFAFFMVRSDAQGEVRWFKRTLAVPQAAAGRRVVLTLTGLHSKAEIFVDGACAATVLFPEGEADLTSALTPGRTHELAMRVSAWPCDWRNGTFDGPYPAELAATTDHAVRKTVEYAGLTGDVYLDLVPKAARLTGACVRTDVARRQVTFVAETEGLAAGTYRLMAEVTSPEGTVRKFEGAATGKETLAMTADWPDARLWSPDTPQALYRARVTLADARGTVLDCAPSFRFGFRDVRTEGKNLLLNGHAVHLRGLYNASWCRDAATCSKPAVDELCRRLKADGVNFIIAGNYAVQPGQFTYLDALLDACDEAGVLYAVTLPHVREFEWFKDAAQRPRYAALTAKMIRHVRNHPCVFAYAMTHNRVGYSGDIDPERLRGDFEFPTNAACQYVRQRRGVAQDAEAMAKALDPTRPVYHHEGGSIGDIQCCNNYLNWAPMQERSEWIRDWAEHGVKPLMFIEWGMPHVASWSSYRGPLFIWTRPAYQSIWAAEFAAALRGDAAFDASAEGVRCLESEERAWSKREMFHYGRIRKPLDDWRANYQAIQAQYFARNLRDFRTWGLTGILPWDQGNFYRRREKRSEPQPNPDAFRHLKRPGIVSDNYPPSDAYWMDMGPRSDFELTEVGQVWKKGNRASYGFIGGGDVFTDQRHAYRPGESIRKQLVFVNDTVAAKKVAWTCCLVDEKGSTLAQQKGTATVESGVPRFVPIAFAAPTKTPRAKLVMNAFVSDASNEDGSLHHDAIETIASTSFALDIIPAAKPKLPAVRLYDPVGLTAAELTHLGIAFERIGAKAKTDAIGAELLYESGELRVTDEICAEKPIVIGRGALTRRVFEDLVLPHVHASGRVLVFEQDRVTLESLGFRVQEYGLRKAFPRFRDTACAAVLTADRLHDWAGEATLVTKTLTGLDAAELNYSRRMCNGFYATRVWRCGTRGNVASVLLEKPTVGDWRALVDGAFDLQYTPLAEWKIERGVITFCQCDVTARTVREPAAEELVKALVARLRERVRRGPTAKALGMDAELALRDAEVAVDLDVAHPSGRVLVVSSGAKRPADFAASIKGGATALCLGFTAAEVRAWSPVKVDVEDVKGAYYQRIENPPPELNGLSNADWAWHGAMDFAAFKDKDAQGNNAFRVIRCGKGRVIFWQVPPWMIDDRARPYLRLSRRRAEGMLARLLGNLGVCSEASGVRYADAPIPEDDPYRYFRW